ncbi:hypothetical protein [Vaccinia virus]|nr:hypothetical protein [Vaccinia virus]
MNWRRCWTTVPYRLICIICPSTSFQQYWLIKMELVNTFLETDAGRVKFAIQNTDDVGASELINKFVELLIEYIHIDQSEFYLVVKDKYIFYFKCDRGSISIVNNEFYVFDVP